jgi:hypothetical protein
MAEIKVEPKRSGLGWLWAIIILALIAAAVWYFTQANRATPVTTPADSTRTSLIDRTVIDRTIASDRSTLPTLIVEGATNG